MQLVDIPYSSPRLADSDASLRPTHPQTHSQTTRSCTQAARVQISRALTRSMLRLTHTPLPTTL
eukprot:2001579-Pyramimonas_sp.AAC.1